MIDQLTEYDKALFRFLNGLHNPWLDQIMLMLTETVMWLPLFGFLAYVIVKEFKKESWIIFLGIALTILLADQITSSIMKPYFERLRPSREPSLKGIVHLVQGYAGGQFGFASSHAANTFGVATFFYFLLGKQKPWIAWLFVWAAFMSYTRIYLGVHYPGDVFVGAAVGIWCAWVAFKLMEWIRRLMKER